jgi:NAD(P)-dependent dehydrogenase (short-subunit alcohol dehydrogenase family)
MLPWTRRKIPDLTGRTAIVTGANSGIGYETARVLALKGADVILACRDLEKGESAAARILAAEPAGRARARQLDLADLDSIAAFAKAFNSANRRLHLLVNNAGVMTRSFATTQQGFELHLGTNHLGHFALTRRLLRPLMRAPGARVVTLTGRPRRVGRIDFEDLNWEQRRYRAWKAYRQSKLFNLWFALELERRLEASGVDVRSVLVDPSPTATALRKVEAAMRFFQPAGLIPPRSAALAVLRAATDPKAAGGSFWRPRRLFGVNLPPKRSRLPRVASDEVMAAALWAVSEELTGVAFRLAEPAERSAAA